MKAPRSALPLPRYVRRKSRLDGTWAYFFEPPTWARTSDCPVHSQPLGTDYREACARAEEVLLPQLDSWRTGGASDMVPARGSIGTFDWLVTEFKKSRRYTAKDRSTRKGYDSGLSLVANYVTKAKRRFGEVQIATISPGTADRLYEKLQIAVDIVDGAEVSRQRIATANAAMRACRRAWNVVYRSHPDVVPIANPFAKMGLETTSKESPAASYSDLLKFVAHADKVGRASLGTAALVTFEWAQREEHIFRTLLVSHYRPKERPDSVRILHPKTGEETWIPLFDPDADKPVPLYPELMTRLDEIKRNRIHGLAIVRDWIGKGSDVPKPWVTESGDLSYMRHETKRLIREAGLPANLSFSSFRHGGVTEASDSDASEEEIRSVTGHRTISVLPKYSKRTMRKVANQARKRRVTRTKQGHLSE